jgi:hypothetical protein
MSYLDTLIETKNNIEASTDISANHKLIVINLIEEKRKLTTAKEDPFYYFFTDVTSRQNIFDFKTKLDEVYGIAQEHANCCINIFISFSQLTPNIAIQNWLSSAIRMVDCIAIHYLQEVLNEEPVQQGVAGLERSRYLQINRQGVKAHKAGSVMDNLYKQRNDMEHQVKNDPNNPGKKILHPPKYKNIMRNIRKRFPEALDSFDAAYKEHYTQ